MAGLSEKQRKILWFGQSPYQALICDGAVRSGKTSIMSLAFVLWGMQRFNGCNFAFCGKSVGSVERNVVTPLLAITGLRRRYDITYSRGAHVIVIRRGNVENRFYLFGGRDESSYTLIQGITLAGVMLDEVALMPRSFVNQALLRCSIEGSKFWFNCNPENPEHWFRKEWILKPEEHNVLHLHFTMDDNPSLSEEMKERYRSTYSGVFYQRYILGLWVMAEGVIYDMFDRELNIYHEPPIDMVDRSIRSITCDYGTTNPCVFYDVYDDGEIIRFDREYRWDSREEHRQKTDEEYANDFMEFMGSQWCTVYVDPSAASFIAALRQRGVYVIEADNNVLDGIRKTSNLILQRKIQIRDTCTGLIDELGTYRWDDKAAMRGEEKPIKQSDHGPDAMRYYVNDLPDWRLE